MEPVRSIANFATVTQFEPVLFST